MKLSGVERDPHIHFKYDQKIYYTSKLQLLAFQFCCLFIFEAKQKRTKFLCGCFLGRYWSDWCLASFTESFFKLELKIFQDPDGRNGPLVIIGKVRTHVISDSSSFSSLMVLMQMIQTRDSERKRDREKEFFFLGFPTWWVSDFSTFTPRANFTVPIWLPRNSV